MREKMIEILRGVVKFHEEQKEKWILGGKVGERPSIIESFVDILIANDTVPVVRCKDCKHYMAEEKERCEAMRATPYGLCLKHRCFPLAGYHEYRNQDDFCSYGERKTDDNRTEL